MAVAEFPWLESNPKANDMALATYNYMVNVEGLSPGYQTVKAANARVAAKLGLSGATREPASAATKARYGAVSGKDTGARGTRVTFTKDELETMEGMSQGDPEKLKRMKTAMARELAKSDPDRLHD